MNTIAHWMSSALPLAVSTNLLLVQSIILFSAIQRASTVSQVFLGHHESTVTSSISRHQPEPFTTDLPKRAITSFPDYRRWCHRSHHRLDATGRRAPCYRNGQRVGLLDKGSTLDEPDRWCALGIPACSMRPTSRQDLSPSF